MEDSKLFKISLAISLIGIFIILIIADRIDLSESNIANLTDYELGSKVKIKASVTKVIDTEKVLILNVKDDTGETTVIAYKEENITVKAGDIIEVKGSLTEYEGTLEIEADLIKLY